jgi:hypothetical protein
MCSSDLRRDYLTLTGTPPVPPLKAFGLWISEYGFDNWGELDGKLSTLRQNGFPIEPHNANALHLMGVAYLALGHPGAGCAFTPRHRTAA